MELALIHLQWLGQQEETLWIYVEHLLECMVKSGTKKRAHILLSPVQKRCVLEQKWSSKGAIKLFYTRGKKEIHPYYISPIEMRSLWIEIKYIKSVARLLDRDWVNKRGLDLSKEVLWVSVGQRAAEQRAVKVGG